MRTFLRYLAIFSILPLLVAIAIFFKADGSLDECYLRFTTPRQTSLILGTSRAAQGLRPHVLDSVLNAAGHAVRSYNYSFAIGFSNYGPAYYSSIQKKLDPQARDGVFILSVDPWSISCQADMPPSNDRSEDAAAGIARVQCVNMDPNVEYLVRVYNEPLLAILLPDPRPKDYHTFITDDGWLQVELSMLPADVESRTVRKVKEYAEERLRMARPSAMRLGYLGQTIDLLKEHGTVVLVRLPVSGRMEAIEDDLMPGFSTVVEGMAREKHVPFIDLNNADEVWTFTDGTHLTASSGAKATSIIANELVRTGQQSQQ